MKEDETSNSLSCDICMNTIEDGPSYTCKKCQNTFCMNCGDDLGDMDVCYFCIMKI